MRIKQSLYLATGDSDAALREEHALRQRAGLPGGFLDHRALLTEYEIARAGALISPGSADADPVQLTTGLLGIAIGRGARMFEAEAISFDSAGRVGRRRHERWAVDRGQDRHSCDRLCAAGHHSLDHSGHRVELGDRDHASTRMRCGRTTC